MHTHIYIYAHICIYTSHTVVGTSEHNNNIICITESHINRARQRSKRHEPQHHAFRSRHAMSTAKANRKKK